MDYFKIKTVLSRDGQACKVEVLEKLGEPKKDQWGNLKTEYNIKLNDKDLLRWDASDTQVARMKEVECNPFCIKRWDKGDKTGFNFFHPEDINVLPQNVEPAASRAAIQRKVDSKQDDFQDKVSRGAAWNNAFAFTLQMYAFRDKGLPDALEFCKRVAEHAEEIAPYQKAFVNGEGLVSEVEAPVEEVSPDHDLPF